jgi:hypothetical protein
MPRGYPKSGKRTPRAPGHTLPAGPASEQTQRLIAALQEIEDRLAVEKRKDKARAMLLTFAQKYDLTAADLREAARLVGAREKGDAPVVSHNIGKAKRKALGQKIREARVAKGLAGTELGKMVGAKGTAAVAQWEKGMLPTLPKYRAGLVKTLDLPKDFFDELKTNGAAH